MAKIADKKYNRKSMSENEFAWVRVRRLKYGRTVLTATHAQ